MNAKVIDCRIIKNTRINFAADKNLESAMEEFLNKTQKEVLLLKEKKIFLIDDQNIGRAAIYAPIVKGGTDNLFGCMVIEVSIFKVKTIDDVLNVCLNDQNINFKMHKITIYDKRSSNLSYVFSTTDIILQKMAKIQEIKTNDRIYGIIPPDVKSGSAFFGQETCINGIKMQNKFTIINDQMIKINNTPIWALFKDVCSYIKSSLIFRSMTHDINSNYKKLV